MPVSPDDLKTVMSRIAATVTVVTARGDDGPVGLTVSSFTSVSADPAIILVCLGKTTTSVQPMLDAGGFTVNVMPHGAEEETMAFATRGTAGFEQATWHDPDTPGAGPVLEAAMAYLECETIDTVDVGDHWVLYGKVCEADLSAPDQRPLVWFGRGFVDIEE